MTYEEFLIEYKAVRRKLEYTFDSRSIGLREDMNKSVQIWDYLRDKKQEMLMYGHTHECSEVFREVEKQVDDIATKIEYYSNWCRIFDTLLKEVLDEQSDLFSRFKYTHDIYEYHTYPIVYQHYAYDCYMHWHGTGCGITPYPDGANVYGIALDWDFSPGVTSTHIPLLGKNMIKYAPDVDGIVLAFPVRDSDKNRNIMEYQLVLFEDEVTWGIQCISTGRILMRDYVLLEVLNELSTKVQQ